MIYEWLIDGVLLYFDLYGELEGDIMGYFESYVIVIINEMNGSYIMLFEGFYGWYWKNKLDKLVLI